MSAELANIRDMKARELGPELRRMRLASGLTLRGFATRLGVSAAHLSDIEHDRRRPPRSSSERSLMSCAESEPSSRRSNCLLPAWIPGTRDWVASTPGVRALLRQIQESGRLPEEIMAALEKSLGHKRRRGRAAVP